MFVVVTIDAQQLPVTAVGRIIIVVMIFMMYGELNEIGAIKFASATTTYPRIKLESLLSVALFALFPVTPGMGNDPIQFCGVRCFSGEHIAPSLFATTRLCLID